MGVIDPSFGIVLTNGTALLSSSATLITNEFFFEIKKLVYKFMKLGKCKNFDI